MFAAAVVVVVVNLAVAVVVAVIVIVDVAVVVFVVVYHCHCLLLLLFKRNVCVPLLKTILQLVKLLPTQKTLCQFLKKICCAIAKTGN